MSVTGGAGKGGRAALVAGKRYFFPTLPTVHLGPAVWRLVGR